MTIGEVCLLTNNVPRLAEFYKQLLGVEKHNHQFTGGYVLCVPGERTF